MKKGLNLNKFNLDMKKNFKVAAVIMAGGKSRRMNEVNKAFLKINGKPIISYVLETIYKQTNNIVINTNRDIKKFKTLGFDVVSDSIKNHAGPLAGILSGMDWLKDFNSDIEWLFSAPTDSPFLPDNIVNKLYLNSINTNSLISVAKSRERVHPVCALWHLSLIEKLRL